MGRLEVNWAGRLSLFYFSVDFGTNFEWLIWKQKESGKKGEVWAGFRCGMLMYWECN